jgi:hypothetical protein
MNAVKTSTKGKSKPKSKPKPKSASATTPELGYAGHKLGSRKGTIHELFDKEGEDVAWTRGLKVGLKPGTLRSWFVGWKHKNKLKTNSGTPTAIKPDDVPVASEAARP